MTTLGTFGITAGLVAIAAAVLLRRGDRAGPVVLVVGYAVAWMAVHATKGATDRPRPAGGLVDTVGSSFPSGHAANAVAWVAVGVALARVLGGRASEVGLVTAGVAIAAVVGLSRIYLRVHYLSDVVAGWGLASAVYALAGIVALLVGHMRNNRLASA